MIKVCTECGKTFIANVANRKTCSDACSEIRKKKYAEKVYAKKRAATLERIGMRICVTCCKEFTTNNPAKVCCSPECQRVRDRKLTKQNRMSTKLREQKIKSSEKDIIDINAKAKAMGLSYGQYVARYGG